MQELEKILEEIEQRKARAEKLIVKPPHDKLDQVANDTAETFIEAYKECQDIIRKHMNDGWIPVEERLPINHEGAVEVTVGVGYRTVGYYDQYREEWWTLDEDSILDVIAWKEPSEPYRPERSMN
ncbi:MAG TPA: hypothetical protein H9713_08215 [Candidatus Mediterraneibacter surreyensis]|nr:hypothetical protein [Candidatus Mediterraneibacter surreyensis]